MLFHKESLERNLILGHARTQGHDLVIPPAPFPRRSHESPLHTGPEDILKLHGPISHVPILHGGILPLPPHSLLAKLPAPTAIGYLPCRQPARVAHQNLHVGHEGRTGALHVERSDTGRDNRLVLAVPCQDIVTDGIAPYLILRSGPLLVPLEHQV